MSQHNDDGYLFDALGRMKEWRCPHCGETIGANLQTWPKSVEGLVRLRREHLKQHEREKDEG